MVVLVLREAQVCGFKNAVMNEFAEGVEVVAVECYGEQSDTV